MAEQTFKSPGFFEREIEIINRPTFRNYSTPYGLIGPTNKGPAFVPTTVTSMVEFERKFGSPELNRDTGHAASEFFLNNGKALTVCRVLGSGFNKEGSKAGFKVSGSIGGSSGNSLNAARSAGAVQFIVANHTVASQEHTTLGILNDSDSITLDAGAADGSGFTDRLAQLVRAMIFMEKDHTFYITEPTADITNAVTDDVATAVSSRFKLIIVKKDNANCCSNIICYSISYVSCSR